MDRLHDFSLRELGFNCKISDGMYSRAFLFQSSLQSNNTILLLLHEKDVVIDRLSKENKEMKMKLKEMCYEIDRSANRMCSNTQIECDEIINISSEIIRVQVHEHNDHNNDCQYQNMEDLTNTNATEPIYSEIQ